MADHHYQWARRSTFRTYRKSKNERSEWLRANLVSLELTILARFIRIKVYSFDWLTAAVNKIHLIIV